MKHSTVKRIAAAVLFIVFLLALCACQESGDPSALAEDETQQVPQPEQAADPHEGMIQVDIGFGQMAWVKDYPDLPRSTLAARQFYLKDRRLRYSGSDYDASPGIDVSSFQGSIDWAAVAADGVEFAMIRLGYRGYTEGKLNLDEYFEQNAREAAENGIKVGVYFFSQAISAEEAREEARFVLDAIAGLPEGTVTMPVAFDWEHIGIEPARTDEISDEVLNACALAFCEEVRNAGFTPMVYTHWAMAYQNYDLDALRDCLLWLVTANNDPGFFYRYAMWQYSGTGSVSGIDTDVDLNLLFLPKE